MKEKKRLANMADSARGWGWSYCQKLLLTKSSVDVFWETFFDDRPQKTKTINQ
jgi:hypothetical protein